MKIDGKEIAGRILLALKERVEELNKKNVVPHLAIVLVHKDPASLSYVNQKKLKGEEIGAKISVRHVPQSISQSELWAIIEQLNNDSNVHGIIVQRPLPKAIDGNKISIAIDPNKDVDGFNPKSKFQPPIALAVLRILEAIYATPRRWPNRLLRGELTKWLTSQKIVVIGKGETGGEPITSVFKKMGIDSAVIDSKTKNPQALTKKADIIISAVGKPEVIKPEMIKRGVILIGVGMHKGKNGKLHGDYEGNKIESIAGFYTPTPGGLGPVNVAMLLQNLVTASSHTNEH